MSVPIRLDLAYSQTHRVTVDIFGFQNFEVDEDFMTIPDEVHCTTSKSNSMPLVLNSAHQNQFHIGLEIFDLSYYETKAAHAAFYLNLWFDDTKGLTVYEFSTHGERQLKKIYGTTDLRLVHDQAEDKLFVLDLRGQCQLMTMHSWLRV